MSPVEDPRLHRLDEASTRRLGAVAVQLYTVAETGDLLRVSKWQIYQLINSRKLASVKINRRRLIAATDLLVYINSLRAEAVS